MRTIEQILADLQAIIDGAVDPENDNTERELTEEEAQRYEALEAELRSVRRTGEFRSRHTAYLTPNRSLVPGAQAADQETDADRAFRSYLRTGIPNQDLEFRAQSEGTNTAGGYLVPEGFLNKITERLKAFGGIAAEAETITTDSGNPLPWPTNDDTANQGEIVAENAAPAGGADLVFGEKVLGAFKYTSEGTGGLPLKVSFELAQDAAFDLEGFVSRKLGDRIRRKQARDYAIGAGTTEPLGLLTGGTKSASVATNATGMTYAEMVAATLVPDEDYLEDGEPVWVMNKAILGLAQLLEDDNGRPLLQMSTDGIAGKLNRTILGYRVVIDNSLPASFTGDNAKTIVFGNIKKGYIIRQVKDITMIVLRELYAVNGQIGYMAWARSDATVQDANAYTVISSVDAP